MTITHSATSSPKKKVAILGGGMGAIATAFALTDPQNPTRNQYDITLYQMGWRLGGKGASGRNQAIADRIEEHSLRTKRAWDLMLDKVQTVQTQAFQVWL